MKKVIFVICMLCTGVVFAANEESVTSREYVDAGIAAKQDTLTTTGTGAMIFDSSETDGIGQKPIYNPNGDYAEQQDALVTASTANTAVQNAIAAEFVCIAWKNDDPNDECLLVQIRNGPNLLYRALKTTNASYDSKTGIMTNTTIQSGNGLNLMTHMSRQPRYNYSEGNIMPQSHISTPTLKKQTFTTTENTHYIYIKHNSSTDSGVWFAVEPSTTYTLLVDVLETNPSIVGGLKMKLMLVRGNWDHDYLLAPGENVYMPEQ